MIREGEEFESINTSGSRGEDGHDTHIPRLPLRTEEGIPACLEGQASGKQTPVREKAIEVVDVQCGRRRRWKAEGQVRTPYAVDMIGLVGLIIRTEC